MKIIDITSEVFEWDRPGIWNGNHFYGPGRLHKVSVLTDEGISGIGWNGGTAAERPLSLMPGFVEYYKNLLVGQDPTNTSEMTDNLGEGLIKILGPGGLHTQALAAINIACWDIKGKIEGKSVHQLLGGAQKKIKTYIAGGYYAKNKGIPELQAELTYNVEVLNATAVKIKIGNKETGFKEDMKRVAAARAAIGNEIQLLVDANCACDLDTAKLFAKALPEFDVYWFEEPLPIHDYEGHKELRELSSIKIATGENGYTESHFKTLIEHQGVDILNVDATIVPGYDAASKITQMAKKSGLTIAPHGCQEIQLPLAASVDHGEFLEYYPPEVDPLRGNMFNPQMKLDKNGFVHISDQPGLGFELNMEVLNPLRIA